MNGRKRFAEKGSASFRPYGSTVNRNEKGFEYAESTAQKRELKIYQICAFRCCNSRECEE